MKGTIFSLTKREQRVVIVIVLALLVFVAAKYYREERLPVPLPESSTTLPSPSLGDEPGVTPNED